MSTVRSVFIKDYPEWYEKQEKVTRDKESEEAFPLFIHAGHVYSYLARVKGTGDHSNK